MNIGIRNELPGVLNSKWGEALKSFPGAGKIDFLKAGYIDEGNIFLKLDSRKTKALYDIARIVSADSDASFLLWLNHITFFSRKITEPKIERFSFPDYEEVLNVEGTDEISYNGMFSALILLSGLKRLKDYYKDKGIDHDVLTETLSDIGIWMDDSYSKTGKWGINQFWWIYNHFDAKLYRLGRLQYIKAYFTGNLCVFRNMGTSEVIALSEQGIRFRSDGQIEGTCGVYENDKALTTIYEEDEKYYTGNAISPFGYIKKDIVRLDKKVWKKVMQKSDPVLDCHIAAGERLTPESCGLSFIKANDFYGKTEKFDHKGFMCCSWLLDPQLQQILPKDSNIVRFQKELYLYPVKSDDVQTFERVFNAAPGDVGKLKGVTAMQRAILDYVKKGNKMHYGAMFLLKEDVEIWGNQSYTQAKGP